MFYVVVVLPHCMHWCFEYTNFHSTFTIKSDKSMNCMVFKARHATARVICLEYAENHLNNPHKIRQIVIIATILKPYSTFQ